MSDQTLLLGLKLYEILTLIGIILGPIAAVIITLWAQKRSEKKQRRIEVLRTLWDTHYDASQPEYSRVIRMVPIEFNDENAVMTAWRRYMRNVDTRPSPEGAAAHEKEFADAKNDLIASVAKAVGINVTDRDIRDSVYIATSYTNRIKQTNDAEMAQIRIANALEQQTQILRDN
ncbi:MAG TPA: DUF6680 family protein [Sphingopyxis sp.]|jgi:hypothetical protein|uniref:DUF6680 family protein n=1 Tax=Sphingopyxis sp. TaxID=1908224 RepID=UPI002E14B813|nr:DUF6680 family protein [Sphingopyxis sp.]